MKNPWIYVLLLLSVFACTDPAHEYPTFSKDGHLNMVVEIPAGTNLKYEYSNITERFEIEIIDGKGQKIAFLPYPGNYGFIPSTFLDEEIAGDGDPLDILLISQALPQAAVVEVVPIGILKLLDNEKIDNKIIAVPSDLELRIIYCTTLSCIRDNYPDVLTILEKWFGSYKGSGVIKVKGWGDAGEAFKEIKKWSIKNERK